MISIRGKSIKAIAYDVAEGYVVVNPLFLKSIDSRSTEGPAAGIIKGADNYKRGEISRRRYTVNQMEKYEASEAKFRNHDTEKFCKRKKNNPRIGFFKN